jgi:hypothetical protein
MKLYLVRISLPRRGLQAVQQAVVQDLDGLLAGQQFVAGQHRAPRRRCPKRWRAGRGRRAEDAVTGR